jgi:hypothetical protein
LQRKQLFEQLPLEVFLPVHQSRDNTITSENKPKNNLRNYSKVDINVLNHLMYQKSKKRERIIIKKEKPRKYEHIHFLIVASLGNQQTSNGIK